MNRFSVMTFNVATVAVFWSILITYTVLVHATIGSPLPLFWLPAGIFTLAWLLIARRGSDHGHDRWC